MVLIVLRHGESLWNALNLFTGWKNVDLSQTGVDEARTAGILLKDYNFDAIFTSDLNRTIETADNIISQNYHSEYKHICPAVELKERDYGELTGKDKTELQDEFGEEQVLKWRRSYWDSPPNGENLDDVKARVGGFFDESILPLLQNSQNVLVVAHGNSLRALFVHLGIHDERSIETFEIPTGVPINIEFGVDGPTKFSYINELSLSAYQIIDSRGFPTIEVKCYDNLTNKCLGSGSSPSGASCGSGEVLELRDGNLKMYQGKSVFRAVANVEKINKLMVLNRKTVASLTGCDKQLLKIDGTPMKRVLGGNTTTAVSFCIASTAAKLRGIEMFDYIRDEYEFGNNNDEHFNRHRLELPIPLVNIINGGKHSVTGHLKIQEFMIFSKPGVMAIKQNQMICEVYHTLQKILVSKYGTSAKCIGDEGGFCPPIHSAEEALSVIEQAIQTANYKVGIDVFIALDCAASEFYDETTKLYEVETGNFLTGSELITYYSDLIQKHPALKSIEDGFHESDYESWAKFTELFSGKMMIVGDDLFTTNPKLIRMGLENRWANTLLLKVNQIGTVSEAIEGAKLMFDAGLDVIVSHRSGETNHAYIVDIAVGIGAKFLKIGSPCRGERVAKFNRLLEIEHMYMRA